MKVLVPVLLAIIPITLFAEAGLPDRPYIYVEGKGEIEKPADMVTLRFNLVTHNADQSKANAEMQEKAGRILTLFEEGKVARTDVIAGTVRSEPDYDGRDPVTGRPGKLVGHIVTRPFSAKIREVAAYPKFVDELLAVPGVEFSGVDEGLSNVKEIEEQVWDEAVVMARQRAEKLLKATGMKIDSVFAISPVSFPEVLADFFRSGEQYAGGNAERMIANDPVNYRLPAVIVRQNVHVIYVISPAK